MAALRNVPAGVLRQEIAAVTGARAAAAL